MVSLSLFWFSQVEVTNEKIDRCQCNWLKFIQCIFKHDIYNMSVSKIIIDLQRTVILSTCCHYQSVTFSKNLGSSILPHQLNHI